MSNVSPPPPPPITELGGETEKLVCGGEGDPEPSRWVDKKESCSPPPPVPAPPPIFINEGTRVEDEDAEAEEEEV